MLRAAMMYSGLIHWDIEVLRVKSQDYKKERPGHYLKSKPFIPSILITLIIAPGSAVRVWDKSYVDITIFPLLHHKQDIPGSVLPFLQGLHIDRINRSFIHPV